MPHPESHPDPYRLGDPAEPPSPGPTRDTVLRSLLWTVVVVSAVTNMVLSYAGAATWVHLICGGTTLVCGATLVVRALRDRR